MLELVFTSAKTGLIPGRSGFCSVAWTEGMPQNLVTLLENMSGYNALYMPDDPKADLNPVCYSYQLIQYGQYILPILSRIAFAGLDYTGRTNKIAHHIIIEDMAELNNLQHGPISAFLCEENFITAWNDPPRLLPRRTHLKSAQTEGLRAARWSELTGKPQWAGIVADSFANRDSASCLYLEYDNEQHRNDILLLIDEIARLLPAESLTEFTFNTCFFNAQNGVTCFLRAALPNCQALPAIKKFRSKDLISLITDTPLPQDIESSDVVAAAITGVMPVKETPKKIAIPHAAPAVIPRKTEPQAPRFLFKAQSRKMPEPPPEDSSKSNGERRTLFFVAIAMLLILLCVGAWIAFDLLEKPEPEKESKKPAVVQVQEKPVVVKQPEPKVEKKVVVKQPEPKVEKTVPKPQPKVETPKVEKPKPQLQMKSLTLEENYTLFKAYVKWLKGAKDAINVPDRLKNATVINVKLNDKNWNPSCVTVPEDYISREKLIFKVWGVKEDRDGENAYSPDKTKDIFRMELKHGMLRITASEDAVFKCIESITFHTPEGIYTWTIAWQDDFLQKVPRGEFDDSFRYRKSEDEVLFEDYIAFEGDSCTDIKQDAEKALRKYEEDKALYAKWCALKKEKKSFERLKLKRKNLISAFKMKKIDFSHVKTLFDEFYELALQTPDVYFDEMIDEMIQTRNQQLDEVKYIKKKKTASEEKKKIERYRKALNRFLTAKEQGKTDGTINDYEEKSNKVYGSLSEHSRNLLTQIKFFENIKSDSLSRAYFIEEVGKIWEEKAQGNKSAVEVFNEVCKDKINKEDKKNKVLSVYPEKIDHTLQDIEKKITELSGTISTPPPGLSEVKKNLKPVERKSKKR